MTRWAIVADLNRCVGCQTCTSACKHANGTSPGVQWRKVLDIEAGEFLVLMGPSGSGKTTVSRIVLGLETPSTGEIWLFLG